MKRFLQFITLLIIVALVAMGTCLLTRFIVPAMHHSTPQDAHMWIHQQLHITNEQEKALVPIENRYTERRRQLTRAIQQANAELANIILQDKAASPRLNAAIEKIHTAQGELQTVTMQHVFEMKAVLNPEQSDKLLKLTAEALKREAEDNH